jgi:hypothetical protein
MKKDLSGKLIGKFECEVGLLYRRQVRNFLNQMKWEGKDVDFFESKGFLGSDFSIRGEAKTVRSVLHSLQCWSEEI